jgi:hypothetical protein
MLEAEHKMKLLIQDRPWETEPDNMKWTEPTTKYKCEVKRNPITLSLLGYVTVPKKHHYYGLGYNDVMANVHGGLTFSDDKGTFGFDCAHAGDMCPGVFLSVLRSTEYTGYTQLAISHDTYRTFDWVVKQTEDLAKELHKMDAEVHDLLIMKAAAEAIRKSARPSELMAEEYKKAKKAWLDSLKEK